MARRAKVHLMCDLFVARPFWMQPKQEEDRKPLNVKVLAKNGYIAGALVSTSKITQLCQILVTLGRLLHAV